MSTGNSGDLKTALGLTGDKTFDDMSDSGTSKPYTFADDWESAIDDLVQTTSGPYDPGDIITVEFRFTSTGSEFSRLRDIQSHYNRQTSQNCTFQAQAGNTFDYEIDSGSEGTTNNTIGISYNNAFNSGTGFGTEQTTTFDVNSGVSITCDSTTYDTNNDDLTVTFTISGGSANYHVDMYRDNDGTPDFVTDADYASTGQKSLTDTNPNSGGSEDEYRLDISDSNSDTDSCTIKAQFTQ